MPVRVIRLSTLGALACLVLATISAQAQTATVGPTSLALGNVVVGTSSAPKTVSLNNSSSVTLNIGSITTTGDFTQTNTCGSALAAKKSCVITVTFGPTATGVLTGSVAISDNATGSPQMVSLRGTGIPTMAIPTALLALGNVAVGSTSSPKVITLTNYQAVPLTIQSIVASAGFAETDTCGLQPRVPAPSPQRSILRVQDFKRVR